jgi:hypothetical protein
MFDAIIPACLEWEGAESLRTDTIRGADALYFGWNGV